LHVNQNHKQRYVSQPRPDRKAPAPAKPRRSSLGLEQLEDRVVPAVFNVNSLADILNPAPGVVTLRSAISAANATPGGNTINLTLPGTYRITLQGGNNDNTGGNFDILATGGNLTINNTSGGKVVVDGGGLDRVFDINPTLAATPFLVTMQGFTITGGVASDAANADGPNASGGGIRDQGSASLTLTNMVITNNSATADGGGVAMENVTSVPWTLTVNNSTISDNHAGDAGGGLETDGSGKVFVNTGTVITGNTSVNQGAGIWLDAIQVGAVQQGANLTVTGTIVSNNSALAADNFGGGIGNAGNGSVTIVSSVIEDNYSAGQGGGFADENNQGALTVLNSLFLNNSAFGNGGGIEEGGSGTTITNSVLVGNATQADGGGLFVAGGAATVTNTRFSANEANNGGAIEDQAATLTVTASLFETNRAVGTNGGMGGSGGGIDAQSGVTSLTISNSLFRNNAAVNANANTGGGGILQLVGNLTVTNSQFTGNTTSSFGGGVNFGGTTATISGSTFNNNQAARGGGLFFAGTGTLAKGTASTLTNDTFVANTSTTDGGGITAFAGGDLVFLNDSINANTTVGNGGGVALVGGGAFKASFQNTIVALDSAGTGPDVFTATGVSVTDNGGNFIGTLAGSTGFGAGTLIGNPLLGPLQNNGGHPVGLPGSGQVVLTEALLKNSPALGKGLLTGSPGNDERGFVRPGGGNANPSIGAFEPQFKAGATANQVYVENLYETLLGRTADAGGLAFWSSLLDNGGSAQTVVQGIEASQEYRTLEVQSLYQRYLHRVADAGGLAFFVNDLLHGGTVEQVAAALVASAEYYQMHGGTNTAFLDALYQDALGRSPDDFGRSFFTLQLDSGTSRQAVAGQVFGSQEYFADLVGSDYQGFLGRDADTAGQNFFVQQLQAGCTDESVLAAILGSQEAFGKRS
jgi:hypothetical protein